MHKMNQQVDKVLKWWLGCFGLLAVLWLVQGCQDDWMQDSPGFLQVEEGIPGELTLQLASAASEKRKVQTRGSEGEFSEQHLHSVYVFIIDRTDKEHPQNCRILARKYFSDILPYVKEVVSEQHDTIDVATLQMPAVSAQHAQIYAIANLGYSDVQGVANDAELLKQCDELTTLDELMKLSVNLMVSPQGEVNVERMQGHHLMSGFFGPMKNLHYLQEPVNVTLRASSNGIITIHGQDGTPYRPIGVKSSNPPVAGEPAALFVHRLDTKITFRIEPAGDFKEVPGAYFRLLSWQVLNAPSKAELYWKSHPGKVFNPSVKNSKVFQRDISQGDDKSWEFSFYQLQNCVCTHGQPKSITSEGIAAQYNKEYNLKGSQVVTREQVEAEFGQYPNEFSNFAYTLRELQEKELPGGGIYEPNVETNDDQQVVVKNGKYQYAPENASMVRLEGRYYNPSEPARRMKDDPRNDHFKEFSLEEFPYWGENEKPVRTKEEALKRTRSATVVYYVHLGYVGGGNYRLNTDAIPTGALNFSAFEEKVNDYNVMRNHHYTYTLKVAGVENIKLEATREDHGNILEQEKQPGAEGNILESQHFFDLDAHYETRNVIIDFTRLPLDYTQGFAFTIATPFDQLRITLKRKNEHSDEFVFVDKDGQVVESIRNHDWDWIHFAWHGTPEDPYRSLIDPVTGNGISYSETYGGYEHQQTYRDNYLTQLKDAAHKYRLLNSLEFSELVWRLFVKWVEKGQDETRKTVTFTMYVDENHYDFNPVTNAQVSWWHFCNKPKRKALFFMEAEEVSADQNSWYADAHLAIYQNSIQTLYATDTKRGQVVANVAFGIEGLDEFRAKYAVGNRGDHPFGDGTSLSNGLFNTMNWYTLQSHERITWKEAESFFTDKCRAIVPDKDGNTERFDGGNGRNHRSAKYAVYSRNRDLDRNGVLDPYEIRWFVPAVDQYTLCFLGGRPVFENPLFEKDQAVRPSSRADRWIYGVPVQHYISTSREENNQIFWAEEGCSKGNYGDAGVQYLYGIRMARMLCEHGVEDTGQAFVNHLVETNLKQDAIFTVSHLPNGVPVDYSERVDGKPYYIFINKMNMNAFRDQVRMGDLAQHTHEEKENWLYRSYRIAKNKIGYTSYVNEHEYDRTMKVNGVARTWWQINGVWSPSLEIPHSQDYYYRGQQHSLAYVYYEELDGNDLHQWRMPNLREAAIMSMAFPEVWFGNELITSITRSDNLSSQSTKVPFWKIKQNEIYRMGHSADQPATLVYARPIQDF